MPWKEKTVVRQREELVDAILSGEKVAAVCREYGVSRPTAYKWVQRYEDNKGLADESRRPLRSSNRIEERIEGLILREREEHPCWGPRKLLKRLENKGYEGLPAASTASAVLKRNGKINPQETAKHIPYTRFERAAPNELWQADFIGDFQMGNGSRCYPLTVLDDCSRYALAVDAKARQGAAEVRDTFERLFREHGLPDTLLTDNAAFWAGYGGGICENEVWLMKHGILPIHGRVYHPQTQGKVERLNRTVNSEGIGESKPHDLPGAQEAFDGTRHTYNNERPHEALNMEVPASRYHGSDRRYDERKEEPEYDMGRYVRKVSGKGYLSLEGHRYYLSEALRGRYVEFIQGYQDQQTIVCYGNFKIARLDLSKQCLVMRKIFRRDFGEEGIPQPRQI
jgi:transposase InsO family protein